jgi:hypothetical protein
VTDRQESHTLGVGDRLQLKRSIWGTRTVLRYAGMPSAEAFSVVVAWSKNYNSAAFNLYLPMDCRGFDVLDLGHMSVIEASPDRIRLVWQPGVTARELTTGRKTGQFPTARP